MRVRGRVCVWVGGCACACISSLLSLVCSASKPEALQRVSERILNWIANSVPAIVLRRSRGHTSVSLYSKGSNKAQDVVATYSQSNDSYTISRATDKLPIVHRGRDSFTVPPCNRGLFGQFEVDFSLAEPLVNLRHRTFAYK